MLSPVLVEVPPVKAVVEMAVRLFEPAVSGETLTLAPVKAPVRLVVGAVIVKMVPLVKAAVGVNVTLPVSKKLAKVEPFVCILKSPEAALFARLTITSAVLLG